MAIFRSSLRSRSPNRPNPILKSETQDYLSRIFFPREGQLIKVPLRSGPSRRRAAPGRQGGSGEGHSDRQDTTARPIISRVQPQSSPHSTTQRQFGDGKAHSISQLSSNKFTTLCRVTHLLEISYSVKADHVSYEASLRVTSDNFMSTLLDKDSQEYKAKEEKYRDMVS